MELGEYLRQAGEYQEELRLYRKAGKLYPFDKWQIQEIDCLMLLKEYKEAYDVYRNTAKLYCEELGVPPGPEMVSRLRRIESQIKNPVGNLKNLKKTSGSRRIRAPITACIPAFLTPASCLREWQREAEDLFS